MHGTTFDKLKGVRSTTSGYIGGRLKNPTYEAVSRGGTGHAEAVQVLFEPDKISYTQLLEVFWQNIDPTTPNRQFCDVGSQYRSAIFYHDETQKQLAQESRNALVKSGRFQTDIVTEIVPAAEFYRAECIRTIASRTPSDTRSTAFAAGATNDSASFGARIQRRDRMAAPQTRQDLKV